MCDGDAMTIRVLVTGATGALGSEVVRQLRAERDVSLLATSRRGDTTFKVVPWYIGAEDPPAACRTSWDIVIHCAASTRWSMTRADAESSNVRTVEALSSVVGSATCLVHISTAFVEGKSAANSRFRNEYERSKALSEDASRAIARSLRIVRPPLLIGRRSDGYIARLPGIYSLLQAVTSGLAPAIVGDPEARLEVAPVDDVAAVVVDMALRPTARRDLEVIGAGSRALTLAELLSIYCATLNEVRRTEGIKEILPPPFVDPERWDRFYLPFVRDLLRPLQVAAVETLSLFHAYTVESAHIVPTHLIDDPQPAVERATRWWAGHHHRAARRSPVEWR